MAMYVNPRHEDHSGCSHADGICNEGHEYPGCSHAKGKCVKRDRMEAEGKCYAAANQQHMSIWDDGNGREVPEGEADMCLCCGCDL